MVEYALLIIAIMLLAALAYRKLGTAVQKNAADSETELNARGAS
jgi:Flp pilus assembly pilin Flp